jgi:nucleoside-diphosphate-sugar epimerase
MTLRSTDNRIEAAVVTGGAGAIGSRLVRRLLRDGVGSVVVIDDLSSGYDWLLPEDPRVTLHVRDVCDLPNLGLDGQGVVVFHLAAFFANQNSVDHPEADLHTNGLGTLSTLRWAADSAARRVVYASAGCSIAGHGLDVAIREDMPVSLHLDTPYQITKALGEFYCNYFAERVSTVRCRFFNSYGPGEVPGTYRNVIPNFIWRALHDEPLVITGTGEETRDFIYVDDLVDGLVRSAVTPGAHGQAINLGTGRQTRIIDLARMIIAASDSRSVIEFAPRRAWDRSLHREADNSRARALLGHSPSVEVPAGIERTVSWFRDVRNRLELLLTPTSSLVEQGAAR